MFPMIFHGANVCKERKKHTMRPVQNSKINVYEGQKILQLLVVLLLPLSLAYQSI
jgi:hypothetical protein